MQPSFTYDCTAHFVHFAYKFTGKERDTESGNDYFGARYFASSMGRFISPDFDDLDEDDPEPVPYADFENPQSLNLYSYVYNNPLSQADPDGHDCIQTSDASSQSITVTVTAGGSAGGPGPNDVSKAHCGCPPLPRSWGPGMVAPNPRVKPTSQPVLAALAHNRMISIALFPTRPAKNLP